MKLDLLKSYLRSHYIGILFSFVISLAFFYYYDNPFFLLFLPVSLALEYYRFGQRLERIKTLKTKGLTEQDVLNIEFIKKWKETRENDIWRYCIRDGGFITGAGLSLVVGIIFAFVFSDKFSRILSEPGDMFGFIGYSYMVGIFMGVILYRFLWRVNEKRFLRLTDSSNKLFSGKKSSFNDLL